MAQLLTETSADFSSPAGVWSLEGILRAIEPAAVVIPSWLLQHVIAHDRQHGESRRNAGRRKVYIIARDHFLRVAEAQNWAHPPTLSESPTLILLAAPEGEPIAERQRPELLRHYWQLLFHARVNMELRRKLDAEGHRPALIQNRIEEIGRSAFNEASFVLQCEHRLVVGTDQHQRYIEFATCYLEFYHFRRDLLPIYFPAIGDSAAIIAVLRQDVDDLQILDKTRLPGPEVGWAYSPTVAPKGDGQRWAGTPTLPNNANDSVGSALPDADRQRSLDANATVGAEHRARLPRRTPQDAEVAAGAGNHVRAAIIRRQLNSLSAPGDSQSSPDLDALAARLTSALQLQEGQSTKWRNLLGLLLSEAVDESWNAEGRLLYDLQTVCINHERELYSVGVVDWLLEGCRRRLRRPQPNQRAVLFCTTLRSAATRVAQTRLNKQQQVELAHLIEEALHGTEARLREKLRPLIAGSLTAAGLCPHNAPERVAENKVVEELLDIIQHRGFLTLGRVRDAIAGNQIKFDDIPGVRAFFTSDPLFRIDRQLSDNLDGIYHRGEIYLRFFQKISSAFFATTIGRFITRTVLVPIGGSFIVVVGLDHTILLLFRILTGWHWYELARIEEFRLCFLPDGHFHAGWNAFGEFLLENMTLFVVAILLLPMVNWTAYRKAMFVALRKIGRGFGRVFIDMPRWIVGLPLVQAVANSRPARFVGRCLLKPLAFAGVAMFLTPHHAGMHIRWLVLGWTFVAVNVLLNSRIGRAIEQFAVHWLRVLGTHVNSDILGNLFSAVMNFFSRRLEDFDRLLYAVDEWLRFRHGQPRVALAAKAIVGIFWFYVAYTARFAVNLLVEPQINPIKHVPVVTVSHKIIFPNLPYIASAIEQLGFSAVRAGTLAFIFVTTIPGVFGFLAWELKSNWKLYRANRSATLKPIPIGSHGETMARLLRPGFHSGTVPKIFARIRRGQLDQPGVLSAKDSKAKEHVTEAVAQFIEREFIHRLNEHPAWADTPLSLAAVSLGPTRISIEIACAAISHTFAEIFFEQRSRWIFAGIDRAGWIESLDPTQSALLTTALLGLYKIASVDLVKEQIEHLFGPGPIAFDISREQLIVWPDQNFDEPKVYLIANDDAAERDQASMLHKVMLKFMPITWDEWVKTWEPSSSEIRRWPINVLPIGQMCIEVFNRNE